MAQRGAKGAETETLPRTSQDSSSGAWWAAMPRILELSPEARPARALWLLRSRTAPGTRGEGHGRQGRRGANTDGKRHLRPASRKQLGDLPHASPASSLLPWRPLSRPEVRAQGALWAEAGEGPGANPEAMRRERVVSSRAAPRLFSFPG